MMSLPSSTKTATSEPTPGQLLRFYRALRGITQEQLADQAGLSRLTVSRFERGHPYTVTTAVRLAGAIGLPASRFIPENGNGPGAEVGTDSTATPHEAEHDNNNYTPE